MLRNLFLCLCCATAALAQAPAGMPPQGVIATFKQAQKRDALVLPNLSFFTAQNQAPTAFLDAISFTAEFVGAVSVDLRGQYVFHALANGPFELLVNSNSVLNLTGNGSTLESSMPVRLNKGTNILLVRFGSPQSRRLVLSTLLVLEEFTASSSNSNPGSFV